jgi:diguanylate cyclase (GGDEF)-like protein
MTLTRKMSIVVLTLLMIIFIGTYLITFRNEREYFMEQLNSNAQDTATSLGLSLSVALSHQDKALILSMVEAVFDRGYFSMIEIRDLHGRPFVSRYKQDKNQNIPSWFITLIRWVPARQSSIVMNGWNQVGEVVVTADPNYAYKTLWENALELLVWYIFFALLSLLSVYLFINWLLRPLNRVMNQAKKICLREFPVEKNLPKTPELRQVTLAMNKMVVRIKRLFTEQLQQIERLRSQSFQDSLTGLGNRRFFLEQLTGLLNNKEEFSPGFLILVAVDGLDNVNKKLGYKEGDKILCDIARLCESFWPPSAVINISNISGSNFALLIRETKNENLIKSCTEFNQLLQQKIKNFLCNICLGVTAYWLDQTTGEVLAEADRMLNQARHETSHIAYSPNVQKVIPSISQETIKEALLELRIAIVGQWVIAGKKQFHRELFARICEGDKQIPAGYFMPVAEKDQMAYLVDEGMLTKVITANLLANCVCALNLTEDTITSDPHRAGYIKKLQKLPLAYRRNLHIEFNETVVLRHFTKAASFVKQLQKLNITVGLDQVGVHFSPLHYLNELSFNYIKLHGSLFQDVAENQNKQFFIHYFVELAKTLDIQVIATQIEREAQWDILNQLGIDVGQGQYLSKIEVVCDTL